MSLLKPAVVEQSGAKIGIFGPGGSGKSLTTTLIAIALSKTFHNGAPVALMDTERASDWLLDIYKIEGVELLRVKSRAFADMGDALAEAEGAGCCVFTVDSYSHPWAELQESLKKRLNAKKLEFHHMQELHEMWGAWVQQFLNSPLHCLLAGRLAYEWENEEDAETGKMGFHKAGTKMRSEKDAGYEPHLLLEMEAVRIMTAEETRKRGRRQVTKVRELKAGGSYLHRLHVLKDRARSLNGKAFDFKDINNYKPGDWKGVYKVLEPHFAQMNIGGQNTADTKRTSAALFSGRGEGAEFGRRRTIALEEIQGSIASVYPGQDAASKKIRQILLERLFETFSWTKVEAMSVERLEKAVAVLAEFRKQAGVDRDLVMTEDGAAHVLDQAMETVQVAEDLREAEAEQAVL